jgi:ribose 5-phosphate isomerase A
VGEDFRKTANTGLRSEKKDERNGTLSDGHGNFIVDCAFGEIKDGAALHESVNAITGVVDNGLFIHIASKLVLGFNNGETRVISR